MKLSKFKKVISIALAFALMFGTMSSSLAFSESNPKEISVEQKISIINQYKEQAINDIKIQLEKQDRLDHLHFYEAEIERLANIELDIVMGRSSYYGRASISAPRGGVEIRTNSYATVTYTYIPNSDINALLLGYSSGIKEFAISTIVGALTNGWGFIGLVFGGIDAFNADLIRMFQREGNGVICMGLIDHTEGNRGSSGYFRWTLPYVINGTGSIYVY